MNKSDSSETMRGKRVGPIRDSSQKYRGNQQPNGQMGKMEN